MSTERLIFIITNRKNVSLKDLFRSWNKGYSKARKLKQFHPFSHNPHTLMLDDVEYTRRLAEWILTRYPDDLLIYALGDKVDPA